MKPPNHILLHLLVLLALSACGMVPAGPSPMTSPTATAQPSRLPDPEQVRAFLVQLVDVEKRAPGIVVGMIAADPQERWVVGYGRLSATDERAPDGDTVFELASVGKVFTRILLAQAVVNGEVQPDDPISMYLPEGVVAPDYEGRSITLLDLATHTSGLPWRSIVPGHSSYTLDQMYAFLSGYRLTRAPGSSYEYSGFGMGLLGNLLVRRAGEEDYEALLEDRITGPLGMDSTHIGLTPGMRSRLAPPHADYSTPASSLDAPTFAGAGAGLRSTANDMLKFLAANIGLTETELQPALQLANTQLGKGIHSHNGQNPGYHAYLAWDTQRQIGVVVLANAAVDIDELGLQLMRGFSLTPVSVDPQILDAYAGRYQTSDGLVVTIRVDGARIFLQIPRAPGYEPFAGEHELQAITDDRFYLRGADFEIAFFRNDRGGVDRMEAVVQGETYDATRIP